MNVYTITQVANQLDIKVHTIRYWEKHVPLLSVQRDQYGKRIYNRRDLYVLLRLKYYIEEKQYTVKGASVALTKEFTDEIHNDNRDKVMLIIKQIEAQRNKLQEVKDVLMRNKKLVNTNKEDDDAYEK